MNLKERIIYKKTKTKLKLNSKQKQTQNKRQITNKHGFYKNKTYINSKIKTKTTTTTHSSRANITV
jgi:hypothetical protein